MKKTYLLPAFLFLFCILVRAQDVIGRNVDRDEIKLNVFNLLVFKYLDGSYGRFIDEESSLGIAALVNLGADSDTFDLLRKFSITPYYGGFSLKAM